MAQNHIPNPDAQMAEALRKLAEDPRMTPGHADLLGKHPDVPIIGGPKDEGATQFQLGVQEDSKRIVFIFQEPVMLIGFDAEHAQILGNEILKLARQLQDPNEDPDKAADEEAADPVPPAAPADLEMHDDGGLRGPSLDPLNEEG